MNLDRAKTILILAFLGLNLFLAYHLFWPGFDRFSRTAVTDEELQELEHFLEQAGYTLTASINRSAQKGSFLTVSPDYELAAQIAYQLIEPDMVMEEHEDYQCFSGRPVQVRLYNSGLLQISFSPGIELVSGLDNRPDNKLFTGLNNYLTENRLIPPGAVQDMIFKEGMDHQIYYHQQLGDRLLFAGYLKAALRNGLLEKLEINWLKVLNESAAEEEMELIPVSEALTRLAGELGGGPVKREIVNIDLGYFSREYDAEKWEVPPVWRVVIDYKEVFYINAFTGNLEGDPFGEEPKK